MRYDRNDRIKLPPLMSLILVVAICTLLWISLLLIVV
jgi:hypothetical protein